MIFTSYSYSRVRLPIWTNPKAVERLGARTRSFFTRGMRDFDSISVMLIVSKPDAGAGAGEAPGRVEVSSLRIVLENLLESPPARELNGRENITD